MRFGLSLFDLQGCAVFHAQTENCSSVENLDLRLILQISHRMPRQAFHFQAMVDGIDGYTPAASGSSSGSTS